MNLVLLDNPEVVDFDAGTPAAEHLSRVLKIAVGDTFWCGVKNGARGLATVTDISPSGRISFSVAWEKDSPDVKLPPVRLLVGLSRPQTMKKIFAAASEIGCARIDVFRSEKGDPAYAESSLWKVGDETLPGILKKSAEQTCIPAFPEFRLYRSLEHFLEENSDEIQKSACVALDVYAPEKSFGNIALPPQKNVLLAIGSERGWTNAERAGLRGNGFAFAHLGGRVLRVETAVAVALSVALSKIDFWTPHKRLS